MEDYKELIEIGTGIGEVKVRGGKRPRGRGRGKSVVKDEVR